MLTSFSNYMAIIGLLFLLKCVLSDEWPSGTYGLPKPATGCPEVYWEEGSRLHETEPQSYASDGNHFDDVLSDRMIDQKFCMKSVSNHQWIPFPAGKYCIFMKKYCLTKFSEGWIYWDDAASLLKDTVQKHSGTLPDGVYDRNTRIYYCCRSDGSAHVSVTLPSSKPFYLLRYGPDCQKVKDMDVAEEYIQWSDERSLNMNSQGGMLPSVEQMGVGKFKYTRIYYCYYSPRPEGPASVALQTFLHVVYVVCGVVAGAIVLAVLIASAQRLLALREAGQRTGRGASSTRRALVDDGHDQLSNTSESDRPAPVSAHPALLKPPSYDDVIAEDIAAGGTADTAAVGCTAAGGGRVGGVKKKKVPTATLR